MGVLKYLVANAQIFRHPAQVFQLQRLAFAGQIIEFAFALSFQNALFRQSLKERHRAGGL
jgi:hypothetical protein